MTIKNIRSAQKYGGYDTIQSMIEDGSAWQMEGSYGRFAMECLRTGACFLPKVAHRDCYGNRIPSRNDLKPGTIGTLENSARFFENVLNAPEL